MESTGSQQATEWCPDRYELRELIGQGGMGKVFRAYDQVLFRDVAIKILNLNSSGQGNRERFLREAKALALLNHPNIVRIFGSGVNAQGELFHVMEFLEGDSLSKVLKNGPMTAARFREVFADVISGLEHAHANRIAHRDLKPNNIICSKNDDGARVYKIIDFGVARLEMSADEVVRTLTSTDSILGSPNYISPEQCRGSRGDHLSDIYSLGCIMYECINGAPPFSADGSLEVMYKHMTLSPPVLGRTTRSARSGQLSALIVRCLQKEPASRPQSVSEIARELDEIFSPSSPEKIDLFTGKRGGTGKPIFWGGVASAILALLASIGLLAGVYFLSRSSRVVEQPVVAGGQARIARDIEARKARPGRNLNDLLALGRAQLKSNSRQDHLEAIKTFSDALELCKPESVYALKRSACFALRARAEWMAEKFEESRKDFAEALRLVTVVKPDSECLRDVLLMRIPLLLHTGKYEEALRDFNQVKFIDKPNEEIDVALRMEKLECYVPHLDKLGDTRYDMFVSMVGELQKVQPHSENDVEPLWQFAHKLERRMHYVERRSEERAVRMYSDSLRARFKGEAGSKAARLLNKTSQ